MLKPEIRSRLADSIETATEALAGPGDRRGRRMPTARGPTRSSAKSSPARSIRTCRLPSSSRGCSASTRPHGACPECHGLGTIYEFDPELIVADESLSLENGAIEAWRKNGKRMNIYYSRVLRQFCRDFGVGYTLAVQGHAEEGQRRPDVRHRRQGRPRAPARGSKASSPTSSGASRTPRASGSKHGCISTCPSSRARPAAARG